MVSEGFEVYGPPSERPPSYEVKDLPYHNLLRNPPGTRPMLEPLVGVQEVGAGFVAYCPNRDLAKWLVSRLREESQDDKATLTVERLEEERKHLTEKLHALNYELEGTREELDRERKHPVGRETREKLTYLASLATTLRNEILSVARE